MLKVTNAKLAGEPAWKLWILHQVARLLRVPIRVRGMPYGHHEISPERPCQADQMRPEQTERALERFIPAHAGNTCLHVSIRKQSA